MSCKQTMAQPGGKSNTTIPFHHLHHVSGPQTNTWEAAIINDIHISCNGCEQLNPLTLIDGGVMT